MLLVKISFDGNNKIKQECLMNETVCLRIAADAGIQFEPSIDIFYNRHLEFDKYKSNVEAANQLRSFFPHEEKGRNQSKLPFGKLRNQHSA